MSLYVGTAIVHEESDRCNGLHCHSCGLDEQGHAWRWCGECGHGYQTEYDLIRAYRANAPKVSIWRWRGNAFEPSIWAHWWRLIAIRADQIPFCPLCMHDL